jgi:hypothetical protein
MVGVTGMYVPGPTMPSRSIGCAARTDASCDEWVEGDEVIDDQGDLLVPAITLRNLRVVRTDTQESLTQMHAPSNSEPTGTTSGCPSADTGRQPDERLRSEVGDLLGGEGRRRATSGRK